MGGSDGMDGRPGSDGMDGRPGIDGSDGKDGSLSAGDAGDGEPGFFLPDTGMYIVMHPVTRTRDTRIRYFMLL